MNRSLCYTAFIGRLILSRTQTTAITICFAIETPLLVACNGALITALLKTKQYKSIANKTIILLSFSDLCTGLVSLPLQVVLFGAFSHARLCWFELMTMFISQTNVHFSSYIIMIIAIQRYFKANPALQFRRSTFVEHMLSPEGSIALVALALIASLGHGLVTTYFFDSTMSKIPNYIMMAFNVAIGLTVYICYIRLFRGVQVHVATNFDKSQNPSANNTQNGNCHNEMRYYKNFTKTIFLLLISFAVCLFPYVVMDFLTGWYSFVEKTSAPPQIRFLYYLSFAPGYAFGAVNAIMFLCRNREASRYIKQRLTTTVNTTSVT